MILALLTLPHPANLILNYHMSWLLTGPQDSKTISAIMTPMFFITILAFCDLQHQSLHNCVDHQNILYLHDLTIKYIL